MIYPVLTMMQTTAAKSHDFSVGSLMTSAAFSKGITRWAYAFGYQPPHYQDTDGGEVSLAEDAEAAGTYFCDAFDAWKAGRLPALVKISDALTLDYKPLENFDRYEESTDTGTATGDSSDKHSGKDTISHSGTDTISHTGTSKTQAGGSDTVHTTGTNSDTGSSQTGVFGYNSAETAAPDTTSSATGSTTIDQTRTDTDTRSNTRTDALDDATKYGHIMETAHGESISSTHSDKKDSTHTGHLHGNIGVTTSQQMLTSELKLRNEVFLEKYIIEDFTAWVLTMAEGVI